MSVNTASAGMRGKNAFPHASHAAAEVKKRQW
jgi:hypothetical protein